MISSGDTISVRLVIQPSGKSVEQPLSRLTRYVLLLLAIVLCGYALAGRAFAYVGVPPLYVGEVGLIAATLSLIRVRMLRTMAQSSLFWVPILFVGLAVAHLSTEVAVWGLDALRDAVVCIYAIFGLSVGAIIISEPCALPRITRFYGRVAPLYLFVIPVTWFVTYLAPEFLPKTPLGEPASLRADEALIHLGGVTSVMLSGAVVWTILTASLLVGNVMSHVVVNRGGMLAYLAVFLFNGVYRFRSRRIWLMTGAALFAFEILLMSGVKITLARRELSAEQLLANIAATVSSDHEVQDLQATKRWRLDWWRQIADYTFFGEYFWSGKGFGINLADSDGHQIDPEGHGLRSPHNSHMGILARLGVPGFSIWCLLNVSWVIAMIRALHRARARLEPVWVSWLLLLLSYWLASVIDMAFTVSLEGPMVGIWFWSVYGLGVGSVVVSQRRHRRLYEPRFSD